MTPNRSVRFIQYRESSEFEDINSADPYSRSSSPATSERLTNSSPSSKLRPLVIDPPAPSVAKLLSILPATPLPTPVISNAKMVHKIRLFRGLKNNKESPTDYLNALEWSYKLDYQNQAPLDTEERLSFQEDTMKILFTNHLSGKAEEWHDDLEPEQTAKWTTLRALFQEHYKNVPQDAKNRLFDLKMKLSELKQGPEESIADYLSRVDKVFSKFPSEGFDIGMAAVKGIQDQTHQDWIEKECRKESTLTLHLSKGWRKWLIER